MVDYTAQDCWDLMSGALNTQNFGYLRSGDLRHITTGTTQHNILYDRGSVIANHEVTDSWTITIYFTESQYIVFNCTNNNGRLEYDCTFYKDNAVYEYSEEGSAPITIGGAGFFIPSASQQSIFAWWNTAGYSVSFVTRAYSGEPNYNIELGLALIPNIYDEDTLYPKEIPVMLSDEQMISYAIIPMITANAATDTGLDKNAFYHYFEDFSVAEIEYDDGDNNPTGGGGGMYEGRNDAMVVPPLPTLSALSTGMVSLYTPTSAQMNDIAQWLWSDDFYDNILKNFSSAFDNIIGLYISPVTLPSASSTFVIGNVNSTLPVNKVSAGYIEKNCGSVSVKKFYNSFADYDNYRSFKCYLPYYGIVDLSTDDFMGGSLSVTYHIDTFTGAATAYIVSTRSGVPHILHQYGTNIYVQIPFSGVNMMSFFGQTLSASSSIVASGMNGNLLGMTQGVMGLVNAHPTYGGSRGVGSTSGFMSIQYPYLIECRSIRDMPQNYSKYEGIPLNKYKRVGDLSGFTMFDSVHVNISSATDSEKTEIERILKEGVIL